jgi:hypothetical protein
MKGLVAAAAGALAAWLYRSAPAREQAQKWLAAAREPLRRTAQSAAPIAATAVERAGQAIQDAPVPTSVKDTATRATETARTVVEKLGGTVPVEAAQMAVLHVQQLPDGTWIGNAAWGGRTVTDGGTDEQLVIRRLAVRLAAMAESGEGQTVTLTRVPRGGEREERQSDLASLLG